MWCQSGRNFGILWRKKLQGLDVAWGGAEEDACLMACSDREDGGGVNNDG